MAVTDFSGEVLTVDGVWLFGEVNSSRMKSGLHCTGQMASCGRAVCWCHHGGGGVMIWADMGRASATINLILQHENAQPHSERICTQFLEAEVELSLGYSLFQLLPVPSNFHTAIEEERTNIQQGTINNPITLHHWTSFKLKLHILESVQTKRSLKSLFQLVKTWEKRVVFIYFCWVYL